MEFGKRRQEEEEEAAGFQMAPMIDIVFQLLIFFMVAAGIIKYESELAAKLPAAEPVDVKKFEEVIIEITPEGRILANKREYDTPYCKDLPRLKKLLTGLVVIYKDQVVMIKPHRNAKYERVIDVLNACAYAKITNVMFSL